MNGKKPFERKDYINKFKMLTDGVVENKEAEIFLENVQNLNTESQLHKLNIRTILDLQKNKSSKFTIF